MLKDKFISQTFLFTCLSHVRGEARERGDNVVFASLNPPAHFINKTEKNHCNRFSDQVMATPQTDLEVLYKKILGTASRIGKYCQNLK
ncbi:hypothetical protein ID47_07005 [Candidatus Paracaedibacter acanthamoebae]|uniref:Uncharacterized protein n=1 Tax=Candidatus Odyssella acanthamoebae TaxID=91604 RepID=A0A077AY27_9PROT|nr:hypothetical protein ID47_07005 [Candidatus Paracaedibacter acanthamoebae]